MKPRRQKTEAEQVAFDQSGKFATRQGDTGWQQQIVASLENASMGAGSFERWERECIRVMWAWSHLDLDLATNRMIRNIQWTGGDRTKMSARLEWLVWAAEQYGGLHVPTQHDDFVFPLIATPTRMVQLLRVTGG